MNWAALSSISDLVAAVAVVVSLLYVAVQLRQNTKAIVASSRLALLEGDLGLISDFIEHAVDPHTIGDEVTLSPEDGRRITWQVVKALRIREFAWHQYKSGTLDEQTWQSYLAPMPSMFASERAKFVLEFYDGSPEFMQVIRGLLSDAKA